MKKITEKQKNNAFGILDALAKSSITSPELRIGILCIAGKESAWIPRREKSYANTSNDRIRKIFGRKKLISFYNDDEDLSRLKKNTIEFFNFVYGEVAGNRGTFSGDGYNYRGGGYGQLTGLDNYRLMQSLTRWALVDKPSLITDPECAADVLVAFFNRGIKKAEKRKVCDTAGFPETAIQDMYVHYAAWINAGIGKNLESLVVQRAYENSLEWLHIAQAIYQEWSKK